jgi:hypothetical protein
MKDAVRAELALTLGEIAERMGEVLDLRLLAESENKARSPEVRRILAAIHRLGPPLGPHRTIRNYCASMLALCASTIDARGERP